MKLDTDIITITKYKLRKAKYENLLRLAKSLKLCWGIDTMSKKQLVKLIWWRLMRYRKRDLYG